MIYIYNALKIVCDFCGKESLYIQDVKLDKPVKTQANLDGWVLKHNGTCICEACRPEVDKESDRKYRIENREKRKEYYIKYAKKNRDIMNAINRRWYKNNPEKAKEYYKRGKERRLNKE